MLYLKVFKLCILLFCLYTQTSLSIKHNLFCTCLEVIIFILMFLYFQVQLFILLCFTQYRKVTLKAFKNNSQHMIANMTCVFYAHSAAYTRVFTDVRCSKTPSGVPQTCAPRPGCDRLPHLLSKWPALSERGERDYCALPAYVTPAGI